MFSGAVRPLSDRHGEEIDMKKWLFVMIAVLLPLLGIARAEGDVSAKETLSKSEYGTGDNQGGAAEAAAMPELPDAADVLPSCQTSIQ